LLGVLKLERGNEFEEAMKKLEEAKEQCIHTRKPDSQCHNKSQEALKQTLAIYDRILDDYGKKLPNRPAPRL
jgi:hypothetical protein